MRTTLRQVDGTTGGGQILRTALTLSLATGEPFRIDRIRAKRSRPGLMRQHLTAVLTAARVGCASVEGAELGSTSLTFRPGHVNAGRYDVRIATAGSTMLVLQTILPVLLTADGPSEIHFEGGTHNPMAPSFDFVDRTFLPLVGRMGPSCAATLHRAGFFPAGGGACSLRITPSAALGRLELLESVADPAVSARVITSGLPGRIAQKLRSALAQALDIPAAGIAVDDAPDPRGPGNAVVVDVTGAALTEVFTEIGRRGVTSERVAANVARQVRRYLEAGAPVGPHLADQLLLPLALGAGGTFRTMAPVDEHTTSNGALLSDWLGRPITIEPESEHVAVVSVG